jgi:hypothetical protein
LIWRRGGYRYPVVLAFGQCGLIPHHYRPDAIALLEHQREPVDLIVRQAVCTLSALPSYWFQEPIFFALSG